MYKEPRYNEVLLISMYFKLWDRAGLNTSFVTYKSVYLLFISTRKQTLNKVMSRRHVQNPRQSCFGVLFIFDLLLKTCSWIFFCSSYLAKTDWIKRPMEHRQKRRETWRRWAEEIACINENNKGGWSTWGSWLERGITVCEAKGLKIRQGE